MGLVALVTWLLTAGLGLVLLAVWLIEYDREFQRAAETRLPIPVISGHALLAVAGVAVWATYLLTDKPVLAWTALAILGGVVSLGLTMAVRWLLVYREPVDELAAGPAGNSSVAVAGAGLPHAAGLAQPRAAPAAAVPPPERNFPVSVVVGHGVLALVTVVLVAVTALRGH
jgi:hypothetical protein